MVHSGLAYLVQKADTFLHYWSNFYFLHSKRNSNFIELLEYTGVSKRTHHLKIYKKRKRNKESMPRSLLYFQSQPNDLPKEVKVLSSDSTSIKAASNGSTSHVVSQAHPHTNKKKK